MMMEPQDPTPSPAFLYAERVVAFIDILGFADLVKRADRDHGLRDQIIKVLGRVRSIAAPGGGQTDLRAQNFSDSLILSATVTPDGLVHLLMSMEALTLNLLGLEVLIRGGVTIGGMHHDEQIVFGVGVNDAYRLESTVAKVPRIVLGSRAMDAANRFAAESEIFRPHIRSRLLRDKDGVWYLNYLREFRAFNRENSNNHETRKKYAFGQKIRQFIQKKMDETLEQPDIYAKIEWLALYWNQEVVSLQRVGDNPLLGRIFLAGQEPPT